MNIAIDIDDTLTESFDYFLPFVAEYFGADVNEHRNKSISYCNLPPEWKKDELGFCKAYYDRTAADTPFNPDACVAENISVLIDDMPANCDAVAGMEISTLLFTSKGNHNIHTDHPRVTDWREVVEKIMLNCEPDVM